MRWSTIRELAVTNWPMKLAALALATILWAAVAAEEPTTQQVAIALRVDAPEGRALTRSLPAVRGLFNGPARELLKLYATPPVIHISIPDSTADSVYTVQLTTSDVEIAKYADVHAQSVDPRAVTLTLENVARRMVAVVPRVTVRADSGFAVFGGIAVTPGSVLVVGPAPRLAQVRQVMTVPLELASVSGPVRRIVRLDTNGLGPVRVTRPEVEVAADVGPVSERVLMGIPVTVRGDRGGAWSSDPPAVIVTVRGPTARLVRLTRDSVEVAALPGGFGRPEVVRLEVVPPPGIDAAATPDSAVVQRRVRG